MKKSKEGLKAEKETYTVEVKYSKESIKNKLVKFTAKKGNSFEISADDLINILVNQVNTKTLSPAFLDVEKVDVVEVGRQLSCQLTEDMKKGQVININYTHPYPIEFALLEEAHKIAKINMDIPRITITKKYLDTVRAKLKPEQSEYIEKFYKSFKNVPFNK